MHTHWASRYNTPVIKRQKNAPVLCMHIDTAQRTVTAYFHAWKSSNYKKVVNQPNERLKTRENISIQWWWWTHSLTITYTKKLPPRNIKYGQSKEKHLSTWLLLDLTSFLLLLNAHSLQVRLKSGHKKSRAKQWTELVVWKKETQASEQKVKLVKKIYVCYTYTQSVGNPFPVLYIIHIFTFLYSIVPSAFYFSCTWIYS